MTEEWRAPSHRLWVARQAQLAAIALVLAVIVLAVTAASGGAAAAVAGAALVAAATGVGWLALRGRVRSWRYLERADDLLIGRGLLFRRLSVVPYGRMQFIDVTAGPVERLFGLATVRLHTAAAATDARIPGLPTAEAQRLRDRLAAIGESRAMGL